MIMFDVVNESTDTAVLTSVKSAVANRLSLKILTTPECIGSYIKEMNFSGSTIELEFAGPVACKPTAIEIADIVEGKTCSVKPDNDEKVLCSCNTYTIKIS